MSQNSLISTTIAQYIAADDEEKGRQFSEALASILSLKSASLLQFIQNLGPNLTSDSEYTRARALECLATTLEAVDPAVISKQDVTVLVDFLIAKLDDTLCVLYVLRGLITIVKLPSFLPSVNGNLEKVIVALSSSYEPRKHLAKVRYHSFDLVSTVVKSHHQYLQTKPSDLVAKLVDSFIHVASGEKDPRNLLISFSINTKLNTTFEFDPEADKQRINDLFDVCFCYFPITFTPPPNDPYKIKSQDLKTALESTIASQSLFASDAFSGLLEKLTSTNPVVRNDVLRALHICVANYKSDVVLQHWLSIWSALKFEILHNDVSIFHPTAQTIIFEDYETIDDTDDNKVLIQTLVVIRELQKQIIKQDEEQGKLLGITDNSYDYTEKFLSSVTSELKDFVSTVSKSFKQAVIILSLLASDSEFLFSRIISFVFKSEIWGKYIGNEDTNTDREMEVDINELAVLNVAKQRELVDCLGYLFISYRILVEGGVKEEFFENNELLLHKDHLLLFLGQLLQLTSNIEKSLKCKVVQQLISLVTLPQLLNNQETNLIYGYFRDILTQIEGESPQDWNKDIVVKEIIKGSVAFIEDNTSSNASKKAAIIEILMPFLMDLVAPEADFKNIRNALSVVKKLSVNNQVLEYVSIRLLNKINLFILLEVPIKKKADVFKEICNTLLTSISNTQAASQILTNSWYRNFLPRFLKSFFELWFSTLKSDVTIVEETGSLIGNIIRCLDKSKHQAALNELAALFLLPENLFDIESIELLKSSTPLVGIFNLILANIDKNVSIEDAISPLTLSEVVKSVTRLCGSTDNHDEYSRLCYLQMLSILSNKLVKDVGLFEPYLEPTYKLLRSSTGNLSPDTVQKFEVFTWLTKGLVMKIDSRGTQHTQELVDLLSNENGSVKQLASRCLAVLVCDLPIFNISSTSKKQVKLSSGVIPTNVRLLYKQRLFDTLLPLLTNGYKNTEDEVYLVSLSILVGNVLSSLLKGHLQELSSMVVSSLPIDHSVIVGAALKTLNIVIDEAPDSIKFHLNSIIERLIALSVNKIVSGDQLINNESIRCEALLCLTKIFQRIDLEYTVPYQKSTIKKLEPALDDSRRLVRKQCCDLRQVLYELGR